MKVYGQLERAQVENVGVLPTAGVVGRIVFLTTDSRFYYDNGSNFVKVVSEATSDTFTNKTIDADLNTITNIENADIKSGAAIAVNKLAATTASRALVSDGSGFISPATTTATEIGYVNGVTSAIQTQLDAKVAKSIFTTKGDILVATGSATPVRQAIGSDNQVLVSDSSVTNGLKWTTLQQGAKNYITYNNFENNAITGWNEISATYTSNVPSGTPTISASAAANLALSVTSTNPLAGTYSLQAALTAPSAGVGFCSDSLTIDREDRAKVMQGSFYYEVASGSGNFSGTSSNTFSIWILDGASTWIQPAGVYSMNQSSGQGFCSFTFQTNSDTSTLRVVVFVNASATITVNFDDFYLGPQKVVFGAPVTDWQSYTPTVTNGGTTSTNTGKWRRVGDSIEIQTLQIFSGAGSAANLLIAPPTGITFDTTKTNGLNNVGAGSWFDASANQEQTGTSIAVSSTNIGVFIDDNGGTIVQGNQIASGDYIRLQIMLPVVSWSSTVQMSNDTDTRVCAMEATTSSQAVTNGNAIIYTSKTFDTHSAYDTATGLYTVPVAGIYEVTASAITASVSAAAAGEVFGVRIVQAGSAARNRTGLFDYAYSTTARQYSATTTAVFTCAAGDTLKGQFEETLAAVNLDGSVTYNYITIRRLSGPSAIAASESMNASAYLATSNQTITAASTDETVVFNTVRKDTHGSFNTSTGVYTVNSSGTFRVTYGLRLLMGATAASSCYTAIFKNNASPYLGVWLCDDLTNSKSYTAIGSTIISCVAGDTLRVIADSTTQNISIVNGTSDTSYVNIERIGN